MIENEHEFSNHQANKRQGIPVSTVLITGINQIHFPTRVINRHVHARANSTLLECYWWCKKYSHMKFGQILMFQAFQQ